MIDRNNKRTPVYLQIKDWIFNNIKEGIWPPHYKLPAEEDLAKQLEVARGTVRQALHELASEGILYRLHGKGTFVASAQVEHNLGGKFLSFLEELVEKRVPFEAEVLRQWVDLPPVTVASYLNLSPERDQVFYLRRLRKVGPSNIMLVENHVVYNLFPGIEKKDFSSTPLYTVIEGIYGIRLDWAMRLFEARPAEGEVAELLGVPEGKPIMFVEQIVYDTKGRCIDCAYLWLRGDKMRLSVTLRRK